MDALKDFSICPNPEYIHLDPPDGSDRPRLPCRRRTGARLCSHSAVSPQLLFFIVKSPSMNFEGGAMLAVNDMFFLASPIVANLFYEDVIACTRLCLRSAKLSCEAVAHEIIQRDPC